MITEAYVNFETAKLLKEKGFDENTNCQYPVNGIHVGEVGEYNITDRSRNPENYIPAPTLQMAMDWLRKKYNLHIGVLINYQYMPRRYEVHIMHTEKLEDIILHSGTNFNTNEEACEAAIKYCLENLI